VCDERGGLRQQQLNVVRSAQPGAAWAWKREGLDWRRDGFSTPSAPNATDWTAAGRLTRYSYPTV